MPNALLERLGMSVDELLTLQAALIRVIDHANTPITTHIAALQAPMTGIGPDAATSTS